MRISYACDIVVVVAALLLFGRAATQSVICPTDCSKCPTSGAYSIAGNMYYCTHQKQCPCNLPGSGCPTLCEECPGGLYDKKDMGGGIELTFCPGVLNSSSCSCISPPLAPQLQQGFVPGFGGVHFVQYQKKNPDVSDQSPDGAYHLDIRIFDSSVSADGMKRTPSLIGARYGVVALGGQTISVNNTTPWLLKVTSPKNSEDNDPLDCVFDAQSWKTDQQPQCNLGRATNHGYQNGKRNGDCGFSIPVPST